MLEGEKKMPNEGMVLLVAAIFFVLSFYFFVTRDKSSGARTEEAIGGVKSTLTSVESNQNQMREENKAVANAFAESISNLQMRLETIEKRPLESTINVHVPPFKMEPIQVNVVEKEKPVFSYPTATPIAKPRIKNGSPLSKRAGLIPKDNN